MLSVFRQVIWGMLMLAVPVCVSAQVAVLTEEPVAKFTLPDGTVLKNAYAWKRTSEGIMIIHDGGQFFLNFKTLPDDWRAAYGIDETVEQIIPGAPKRPDTFGIYPLLKRVQGLSPKAVAFFESTKYEGQIDTDLLSISALQALMDGNTDAAVQIVNQTTKKFPEYQTVDLTRFLVPCENCSGTGVIVRTCPECEGSGTCPKCGGTGELESQFIRGDPLRCVDCRGEGKCVRCGGSGSLNYSCGVCQRKGRILLRDELKAEIALQAAKLNKWYDGHF